MHERSLVKGMIEQVLEEIRIRGLGRIYEIELQIGEFAGVEPRLVESAFAEMALEVWSDPVQLSIEIMTLTARCQSCQHEFHVSAFRFHCPVCGCGDTQIVAGEEMRIVNLHAQRVTVINS